jgi:hypothetical protein
LLVSTRAAGYDANDIASTWIDWYSMTDGDRRAFRDQVHTTVTAKADLEYLKDLVDNWLPLMQDRRS